MDEEAPNPQLFAYQACLEVYGDHFDFMGFIDTDGFVVLHNDTQLLPEFLAEYTKFGGVALNEMFFGSASKGSAPHISAFQSSRFDASTGCAVLLRDTDTS
jgi:hypothetical protein